MWKDIVKKYERRKAESFWGKWRNRNEDKYMRTKSRRNKLIEKTKLLSKEEEIKVRLKGKERRFYWDKKKSCWKKAKIRLILKENKMKKICWKKNERKLSWKMNRNNVERNRI